ncbi:hypothetical protein RUM43_010234 [Polyplax serrata]|uniref:Uncharacterized protein n=1 Tax=Polyplax serrata TaxID=468196 RepID=A0AAN8PKK2_POLSC
MIRRIFPMTDRTTNMVATCTRLKLSRPFDLGVPSDETGGKNQGSVGPVPAMDEHFVGPLRHDVRTAASGVVRPSNSHTPYVQISVSQIDRRSIYNVDFLPYRKNLNEMPEETL